jgi:hypothetical protein
MRSDSWTIAAGVAGTITMSAASAQEPIALKSYTCAEFLSDINNPSDPAKSLKSLMAVSWATGFASAYNKSAARADTGAMQLIAGALSDACRKSPQQKVIDVAVATIDQFATGQKSATGEVSTAPISTPVQRGAFKTYDNYDLVGGDLRKLQGIEHQACSSACSEEPVCKTYSYDKWNRYCYLKNEARSLTFDASSITGVRSSIGEPAISDAKLRMERRLAKKFSGEQFRSPYKTSLELCESVCADNTKCLGYTFAKKESSCQLLQSITTFFTDQNTTSAFKTQNPP